MSRYYKKLEAINVLLIDTIDSRLAGQSSFAQTKPKLRTFHSCLFIT